MYRKLIAALLAVVPAAAHADWRAATSTHFVVYTEGSAESAKAAAERLEKFDRVIRFVTQTNQPSSPIKVRIWLMRDESAVQAVMPFGGGSGVLGFYNADVRGPYAVMTRTNNPDSARDRSGYVDYHGLSAQQVLLHELTHHFMYQYFPAAYPSWYSEGFADYNGSVAFGAGNVVEIGALVENRFLSFRSNRWLPVAKLLTARRYADVGADLDLLYAEGWALVHYLSITGARPGQLEKYLNAINAGTPFDKAARDAFGDLGRLDGELHDYVGRSRFQKMSLPFKSLDIGPVTVRALTPVENVLLPYDRALSIGVPQKSVGDFADRVVAAAAPYGDEAYALGLVAEAQRLAGRRAAAAAAAERWVKIAPNDGMALDTLAMTQMDALADAKVTDAAHWKPVRAEIVKANRLAPDEPRILKAYYDSYQLQGILPPEPAQNALFHALELLPQDGDLRHQVAADFETRGMIGEAITVIRTDAYKLGADESDKAKKKREEERAKYRFAGQRDDETAAEMLVRLEKKKAGGGTPAS